MKTSRLSFISLTSLCYVFLATIDVDQAVSGDEDANNDVITRTSRRGGRRCYGGGRDLLGQLSSAVTYFSANLHTTAIVRMPNCIYSPYSVFQALGMTYLGARRLTAYEMKKTMSLRTLGRCAHEAIHLAAANMSQPGGLVLKSANRIYIRDDVQLADEFQQTLRSSYNSSIQPLDWDDERGPEGPINDWVSSATEGLIPDLLLQGTISSDTAMVLVNAIYFKANWTTVFKSSDTTNETFHQPTQQQTTVPMMHLEGRFRFARLDDHHAQVLFLPYTGNRFGMFVILPDDIDGLPAVESALTSILADSLDSLSSTDVRVSLPKFKLESSFDLKEALIDVGMVRPFSARHADFSRMTGRNNLYMSRVIHRAVVDVTETGTEAAGLTAISISLTSFIRSWTDFKADHPFVFVIRDNLTKIPLFVGKYSGGD
ncbi:leukocyte elastase inhibitor-like [Gigantopelta aegis]|uniref:leukocyte elastase inhibitor-like n=1 Tax=Gigantopelta aegis TaxID=1735272 RepID=UPI001B88D6A7|nr:leukocyte elastase inhibitor-like [Gigantopelta aegis]